MCVCFFTQDFLSHFMCVFLSQTMEGLPMLTCLIQHTLKTLCSCSSSHHNKWVYSVFWRILPRIYPPPKWDAEGGVLDRVKGNKRNWILVWEDGFCDLDECERVGNDGSTKGGFGAEIFFKLSHEVYNYGEGLLGKVAADNSHRWVFNDALSEQDASFSNSSWNASIDPQPRAWELHFNSGIKTIAMIAIKEGIIQLGSFDKILEDVNLVLNIQRKFNFLHNIPGLFSTQRSLSTLQHPYNPLKHKSTTRSDEAHRLNGSGFDVQGEGNQPHKGSNWAFGPCYINQVSERFGPVGHGPPVWPIPPLLPYNFGSQDHLTRICNDGVNQSLRVKMRRVEGQDHEEKPICLNPNSGSVMELGFGPNRVVQAQDNDVKSQIN